MEFKETNAIWNQQSFNSLYLVGGIMKLIRQFNPKSPEEFENLYYRSGEERLQCLIDMSPEKRERCNDILFLKDSKSVKILTKGECEVQMNYGRDPQFIRNLAKEFGKACNISTERALTFVKKRLFIETFLGWKNEQLAVEKLNKKLSNGFVVDTADDKLDAQFAVDLVIKKGKEIIAGVQVKPKTYAMYRNAVSKETSSLNKNKNNRFSQLLKKPVLWFYYDDKGNCGFDDKSAFILNKLINQNT